jgi:glycosyltransferase involved in cell wall biosynthesis
VVERFRILHCLRAPVGGLFRHVLDLSAEQSARGHDVGLIVDSTVADPLTERRLAAAAPRLSLGIARIPMGRLPGLGDAAAARAVRDLARRQGVNVLHGHGAKGGAYARLAARLLRGGQRRVISLYTPHGGSLHFPPGSAQALLFIGLEKALARITDGLVFESDFIRRIYEARVGRDLAPTRVITNALQPSDFTTHVAAPDAADFLFVGELRHLKGVDILLRALAEVARVRPVRAVIVGAGPDRKELEQLARGLGLKGDTVAFAGAMPARDAFPAARCIVVPSRAESLPFIVLEAAAAELPLIATNVGGIPEIVRGSDTELLPPDDVSALVRALHGFLDAPEAAKERARRLKQTVAARFAIATTTTVILDFYAELLAR